MTRRGWATTIAAAAVAALVVLLFTVHVNYLVLEPGPVCNAVGKGTQDCPSTAASKDLIVVSGGTSYPSGSRLGITTVEEQNSPPSIGQALFDWLSASKAVVPREIYIPPKQSQQQTRQQDTQQMQQAQSSAVTIAEATLGLIDPTVETIAAGSAAQGVLRVGDVVVAVDGVAAGDSAQVAAAIGAAPAGHVFTLTVRRAGETMTFRLARRVLAGSATPVLGVSLSDVPTGPRIDVALDPNAIGGPSAGLMLALGVYDVLTPGDLTGSTVVAGTGTIDGLGNVGEIGGIQQKMYASRHDFHATVFLAPAGDCPDTRGAIPKGLRVVKVSTYAQALTDLAAVRAGRVGTLPSC